MITAINNEGPRITRNSSNFKIIPKSTKEQDPPVHTNKADVIDTDYHYIRPAPQVVEEIILRQNPIRKRQMPFCYREN